MSRTGKAKGRSALHIIAGLLLASAILRIATEAGPAVAQVTQAHASDVQPQITETTSEATFLSALQAREANLDQREAMIDEKMRALDLAQSELEDQLLALTSAEEALQATIAAAEIAAETDVAQLTTVYENMKPKEAAALFEEMSPDFAAGFLGLMRPDIAAAIMTQLSPETAYSFSVVLAGRNAQTPTN